MGDVPQRGAIGRACRRLLSVFNRVVSPLESWPRRHDRPLRYPPIFIVGPPRSGTTLVYQALIEYLDVGYLSNFHGWFWGAPSWVE